LLAAGLDFGQTRAERNLRWFDHSMFFPARYRTPLSIGFAFVSTHNHFVLDRGGKVFKQTAPAIKLASDATADDYLRLVAVLTSSTACFWLKQVCHDRGNGGVGGGIGDEEWERRFEYTSTKLEQFPLPSDLPVERARRLDLLAQRLSQVLPAAICANGTPTREALATARAEADRLGRGLGAEHEELDWEGYRRYRPVDEGRV